MGGAGCIPSRLALSTLACLCARNLAHGSHQIRGVYDNKKQHYSTSDRVNASSAKSQQFISKIAARWRQEGIKTSTQVQIKLAPTGSSRRPQHTTPQPTSSHRPHPPQPSYSPPTRPPPLPPYSDTPSSPRRPRLHSRPSCPPSPAPSSRA